MSAETYSEPYGGEDPRRGPDLRAATTVPGATEWPTDVEQDSSFTRRGKARRGSPRGPWRWLVLALLTLVVLTIAAASGGLYYLDQSFAGRIYPNISVRGVPVGQMTPEQALSTLQSRYEPFLERPVVLTFGEQTWYPSLGELGARIHFDEAVTTAMQSGRGADTATNLWQVAAIWQRGIELPLRLTVDQAAMQRYLSERASGVNQPARDAQLLFEGVLVGSQSARPGRQLLFDETMLELTAALQSLEPQQVALRTRLLEPLLYDAEVEAARTTIESILQGPLLLNVNGEEYEWTAQELARMIQIARVPATGGDTITVALDQQQIARRLWPIAEETGIGSIHPRVAWNNGNLQITQPGKPGKRIDESAAVALIVARAGTNQRVIDLPLSESQPISEGELANLGIVELVSVGKSDFSGSAAYRITNIQAGMRLLDGILLAPGEEFSFNNNVGRIDASNGFVEGYAIVQNRTQLEFGGGICQDSTTIFRAAFWAGLPITERREHSFYISWYDKYGLGEYGDGPGLDATIYTGAQDLKFVNDTGNWLLIETAVDTKRALAEVRLYGTKLDRSVELTHRVYDQQPKPSRPVFLPDPKIPRGTRKQSDTGRGGMTIDVYRIITENGVRREPELFRTRFRAWPDIFLYNPADLGSDGRPLPPPPPPVDPNQPPPVDPNQPPPVDPNQPPADPSHPPAVDPNQQPPTDGAPPPLTEEPAPAVEPALPQS